MHIVSNFMLAIPGTLLYIGLQLRRSLCRQDTSDPAAAGQGRENRIFTSLYLFKARRIFKTRL